MFNHTFEQCFFNSLQSLSREKTLSKREQVIAVKKIRKEEVVEKRQATRISSSGANLRHGENGKDPFTVGNEVLATRRHE